jgi:hypothetical protein
VLPEPRSVPGCPGCGIRLHHDDRANEVAYALRDILDADLVGVAEHVGINGSVIVRVDRCIWKRAEKARVEFFKRGI